MSRRRPPPATQTSGARHQRSAVRSATRCSTFVTMRSRAAAFADRRNVPLVDPLSSRGRDIAGRRGPRTLRAGSGPRGPCRTARPRRADRWNARPVESLPASLEHQDGARHLAGLHRAKRLVHVLELSAPRDHLVQAQEAALVEVDVLRHVDLEAVRAHAAALDALLAKEHAALELELLTDR